MKKILLGFIAIGLITFVGCEKDDDTDTETTDNQTVNNTQTNSNNSSDDGTTDDSSIKYGEGATDIDGNTYQSVIIGAQEWMTENLRTTKYSDGAAIPNVTDNYEWYDLSTGAWCHYDNDNQYDTIYGKLYNWYAVETGKLCPTGWHVPTDVEWTILTDYLAANGHSGTEGKALKANSGWDDYWDDYKLINGNGTDDYGFLGLPGGKRYNDDGNFYGFGVVGYWWSSSQYDTGSAWSRDMFNVDDDVSSYDRNKENGYSVRCLRD